MKIKVWVLSTCIPSESRPCYPEVFGTEKAALARFDEAMRGEWECNAPHDDEGKPLPYPDDPYDAVEAIQADDLSGEWGAWELSSHDVEV